MLLIELLNLSNSGAVEPESSEVDLNFKRFELTFNLIIPNQKKSAGNSERLLTSNSFLSSK